jgi:hypothetical protein
MQRRAALTTTLTAGALVLGTALPTQAGGTPTTTVMNSDVLAPFNLSVSRHGVFVADGFTGQLSELVDGELQPAAEVVGAEEVAGVDVNGGGRLAWVQTNYTEGASSLEVRGANGYSLSADLWGYEERRNPDRKVEYGVDDPSDCVRAALEAIEAPVEYTGIVESHPYSVASWKDGSWLVADAAGNDILAVDRRGRTSVVAVLPPQPLTFTAEQAASLGLPDCVVGETYRFEPVPTDVEVGADGTIYVSTLPGGPESPELGARGSVWKINPNNGKARLVATGFLGATNLAVDAAGKIYVTELFAGRVSTVHKGAPKPFVEIPGALSVETSARGLWVGTLAPIGEQGPEGPGTIVRVTW